MKKNVEIDESVAKYLQVIGDIVEMAVEEANRDSVKIEAKNNCFIMAIGFGETCGVNSQVQIKFECNPSNFIDIFRVKFVQSDEYAIIDDRTKKVVN
jgi:hypothetical protein